MGGGSGGEQGAAHLSRRGRAEAAVSQADTPDPEAGCHGIQGGSEVAAFTGWAEAGQVSAWPAGRRSVSTTPARTTTTPAEETARKLRTHKKDAEVEEQTRQNLDQGPKHGDDRGPRYTARSFVNEVMATGSSA